MKKNLLFACMHMLFAPTDGDTSAGATGGMPDSDAKQAGSTAAMDSTTGADVKEPVAETAEVQADTTGAALDMAETDAGTQTAQADGAKVPQPVETTVHTHPGHYLVEAIEERINRLGSYAVSEVGALLSELKALLHNEANKQ